MSWQERLLEEYEGLTIRIEKLEKYIEDNNLSKYSLEMQQLRLMIGYQSILEKRIIKIMKGETKWKKQY